MRVADYYRGTNLELATHLPPEEVERRINDAAASTLSPFATGMAGWASSGAVLLRFRRSAFIRNDARPILAGTIRADRSGSRLQLRYRGPLSMLLFYPAWYLILFLSVALILTMGVEPEAEPMFSWFIPLMVPVFLCAPALVMYLGLRGADADLDALVAFLKTNVAAKEVRPRV